jgi:hypothetical protein
MEVNLGEPFVVRVICTRTDLVARTKTRIEIDIIIRTWTKIDPFTKTNTKINPAAKTKVEEVVPLQTHHLKAIMWHKILLLQLLDKL